MVMQNSPPLLNRRANLILFLVFPYFKLNALLVLNTFSWRTLKLCMNHTKGRGGWDLHDGQQQRGVGPHYSQCVLRRPPGGGGEGGGGAGPGGGSVGQGKPTPEYKQPVACIWTDFFLRCFLYLGVPYIWVSVRKSAKCCLYLGVAHRNSCLCLGGGYSI